jgi:glycosyltransferase involved in cell wall biosynthesis
MPTYSTAHPPRVLLACAGLDHAHRGFESFARECFDVLRHEPGVDLELIKGSGPPGPRERAVPTLKRDSRLAGALGRASGRESFRFEHLAFALSLQPLLVRHDPDLVYLSEWDTGRALAWLRRRTGRRFKLLLNNGTMSMRGFDHLDHVQQLTPVALETVLEHGGDPARHTMLPLGFSITPDFEPVADDEGAALRERLDLPVDRRIVVSVAAINRYHKRLDYLIEEVARLPEPRPFVLMAGQVEPETAGIRTLARERLGEDGHSIRTVPQSEVVDLCRASDSFVLASLGEGLPRALVEGMDHGLPCLTHDYGVSRFALGEYGHFADFSKPGGLAQLLDDTAGEERDPAKARERHRFAYENFSWGRLRPRYLELLARVAAE